MGRARADTLCGPAQSLLTLSDGLLSTAFGVKANVITNLRNSMTQYPLIRPLSEPVSTSHWG
jgi:hypothetical protein